MKVRQDLGLVRDGLSVGWEFGAHSLAELTRIAEFLEHCVYEPGSLSAATGGARFVLRNPPLRMGAFSAIRVQWDGRAIPGDCATVQTGDDAEPRRLSEITALDPITFGFGRRTTFRLTMPSPTAGEHHIRVEWQSVAVPPLVWLEFREPIAGVAKA